MLNDRIVWEGDSTPSEGNVAITNFVFGDRINGSQKAEGRGYLNGEYGYIMVYESDVSLTNIERVKSWLRERLGI